MATRFSSATCSNTSEGLTRVEQIVLGWFAAIIIYLIFAVDHSFWCAFFYGTWHIFSGLLLWELRGKINRYLLYSALVFDFEYLCYNIIIAFDSGVHPKLFVAIFIISIIVLLLTTFIYNIWHSRR